MLQHLKVNIVQFHKETGNPVQLFQGTLNGFFIQYENLNTDEFTFRDLNGTLWEGENSIRNLPTLEEFEKSQ